MSVKILVQKYLYVYTRAMGIELIEKAIKKHGSQAQVARLLDITPQRLNNWLRAGEIPDVWEWGLEQRLGLNGRGAKKNGA
jgi:hypothetical protein